MPWHRWQIWEKPTMHLDILKAIKEEELKDEENNDKNKEDQHFADQTFAVMRREVKKQH